MCGCVRETEREGESVLFNECFRLASVYKELRLVKCFIILLMLPFKHFILNKKHRIGKHSDGTINAFPEHYLCNITFHVVNY